jgi:hypothetical protein
MAAISEEPITEGEILLTIQVRDWIALKAVQERGLSEADAILEATGRLMVMGYRAAWAESADTFAAQLGDEAENMLKGLGDE